MGRPVRSNGPADLTRRLVDTYGVGKPVGGVASADLTRRLTEEYSERATVSAYERGFYTRDMAPLPAVVDWVFRTLPDVVVRPRETAEVTNIVALAHRQGAAITVRAGASTSLGGCVPVRGGVLLDLSKLTGVLALDLEARTVRVRSGTVWTELEQALAGHHLEPMTVPSSAPASTVGGWLCTGGYGIGSLKYGPLVAQVRSIEVVLADGTVRRLTRETDPPLEWFAGSEGTLGVVTEVELTVRETRPMCHALIACPDSAVVHEVVRRLLSGPTLPYSIHFDDRRVIAALAALGHAPSGWDGSDLVRVDWEGLPEELEAAETVVRQAAAAASSTRLLSSEVAAAQWRERYHALRVKRGGPSVVGAETLLPLVGLEGHLRDVASLARRRGMKLMTYGHLAGVDMVVLMSMYYTDETKVMTYLLDLGLFKKLHDIGPAHGGTPYGLALWNTPHLRPRLASLPLSELRRRKYELDPTGIMNPGKGVARLALMNPAAMRLGMEAAATVRQMARRVLR